MQGRNKSSRAAPQRGDGTLPGEKEIPQANWYGPSLQPQEEFIENDPTVPEKDDRKLSEGKPTMGGGGDPDPLSTTDGQR